ncbi:TPA: hypothetical protein N3A39_001083 [Salmonella enterica subsp. salamae serovar 52:z:z39]|nr:hypothetical protein [Salmonella enterica subsp. salamae serovar 52:z:z39]
MKEWYYWIQHNGVVQVAYYTRTTQLTIWNQDRLLLVSGIWYLIRGDDICHNGEA